MRWIAIALAGLAFAVPSAEAAPRGGCGPKSAHTVRQSATIRVFKTKDEYDVCWRPSHGEPTNLQAGSISRLRLRGRYLAYVATFCAVRCQFTVEIIDVKRGRDVVLTDSADGSVRTLVATRGGAAAFLAEQGGERYVEKLDSLGPEEIDRGPEVRSLTLRGGRLHWLHGTNKRDDHIAHTRSCGPVANTYTLALSRNARVYYTPRDSEYAYRHYACLLGGGKPFFLESEDAYPSTKSAYPDAFQLVGHQVFWLEFECYMGGCTTELRTADLATRKRRAADAHSGEPVVYPNKRGFAATLYPPPAGLTAYQLYGFDSAGERLLDQGPGIDPASIVVYTDAVVWRKDGEQHSAPLR
jgi:hypothetical protein